jgi:hypothetical protein
MMSEHHELAIVLDESLQKFSYAINFSFSSQSVCHHEGVFVLLFGAPSLCLFGEIVTEIRAIVGNQCLHALLTIEL